MLINRDGEIAALNDLFRDSARGKAIVAVISGPVAAGKTTLLQAFAEQAVAAGAIVLGAAASWTERSLPLSILDQLFRGGSLPPAIAPRAAALLASRKLIGTLPEPEPEKVSLMLARVFEGLLGLLAELSADCPVVIAVDDMQYADVASLRCLSYLARRAGTSPILIVLTECTHMLPADRLLHAEILRQGNCHRIPLVPLSPSGVARLLAAYVDAGAARRLAPACHDLTGGNPLLVKALGEDSRISVGGASAGLVPADLVPGSAFRSAVATCLHRHEPGQVELAQAAAVLGEDVPLSLLAELLAISPESVAHGIDALRASGLLESGRFRHEQARQAVLGQMTADERAVMHGSAARTLYRTGAASGTLAKHLMAAHRIGTRWAVAALQDAGEQALAAGEVNLAIDYLRRAEGECTDDRQHAAIRFSLACAEWPVNPECAARHLSQLVADAHSGRLESNCLSELAYYLMWVGDTGHAAEILAALDDGLVGPSPGRAAFPVHHLAILSPLDFLYPDLARRARQLGQDGKGAGRTAVRLRPREVGPALSVAGKDSELTLIDAERILFESSLTDHTLASVTTALMALICEDMLDQAASWCDMLLRESEASCGRPLRHAVLKALLAMIETRRGNLPAAEDHARTALALLTKKAWGVAIGAPLSSLLLTAIASRKHEDAAAYLRLPVPEAMFGTSYGLLYLHARGEYYLATGRPQAALADFTDCGSRMVRWKLDLPGLIPWRTKAAEAHLVMGNSLRARELSQEQLAQAGSRFSRTRGISLRALALTCHPAERVALLRESAEILRDSGAWLELASTFTELSNAHLALGEHDRVHWARRQARNLAERCGAQAPRAGFSEANIGRPESGNGGDAKRLAQLSDAEQRVAMLAAYGYTNGQIARRLYITVSTVEQHLTRVYRKLGVAGRAELPVEMHSLFAGLYLDGGEEDDPAQKMRVRPRRIIAQQQQVIRRP